jgi:hypothetical protein
VQRAATLLESFEAQFEFLFRHRHPDHRFEPHGRLGGVQRGGERQVVAVVLQHRIGIADGDDRDAAGRARRLQPPGEAQAFLAAAGEVDDGRFDLQVGDGGDRGVLAARRDRAPAKTVQPLGKRAREGIIPRDNQNPRLDACNHIPHVLTVLMSRLPSRKYAHWVVSRQA